MTRDDEDLAPGRPGRVLAALILVAAVANLNLAVANVALLCPACGKTTRCARFAG